jgi:hypothetical protein
VTDGWILGTGRTIAGQRRSKDAHHNGGRATCRRDAALSA